MFGRKGLVNTIIEMPEKAIEFGHDTMFGKQPPRKASPLYHKTEAAKQVCPVCDGRCTVPSGFYDGIPTTAERETCRTCNGRGVI